MQYCKRCAYPENHALGITFNQGGVCSGCIVHEEKDVLPWQEREQKLIKILNTYRNKDKNNYDCIIPVSGGKDSFFITDLIKNKYKMNPLLVSYNRLYNTKAGIYNLEQIRTQIGCDIVCRTPNPDSLRRLIHHSIEKVGSVHWPYLAGSTAFPVQVAVQKNIPLIIWGAHQGLEQVGMFSHLHEVEMTRRYRKEHDLMGLEAEEIAIEPSQVEEADLKPLFYPEDSEIHRVGVRGIYLGNYIRWDTKSFHEAMHKKYEFCSLAQQRTFDSYNDIDCQIYNRLHDVIKFRKLGYSKINDHVAREVRYQRISVSQGIALIKHYQSQDNIDSLPFLEWLDIDPEVFWQKIDVHRDARIWAKNNKHEWYLLDAPWNHIPPDQEALHDAFVFHLHLPKEIAEDPYGPRLLMRGGD
ncbi:MAG: N-acetyl sugar amidotransferase [Alphaproteobacteria bacterium]|nr:N-acetyl sugar amidotransferase [Alphaproteobacteria bacterium]